MANPFEDPEGTYVVLVNSQGQHSLWPAHIARPDGWTVTFGEDTRQACLDHIDRTWTDLMPRPV
ncbi:MbtH family protein, partial [Streptomyces sp. UNOC14_S4]|uniref:MbtH family protein n=1 Tax=Streptomyces sp. UNOC14_S4 TaxID=2872340 RepID=UPI001E5E170F